MARISSSLLLMSRRAFSVATENIKVRSTAPTMKKAAEGHTTSAKEKEAYWMRDPKTGNWMPETHFEEVNIADLRSKLLSKNPISSTPSN